MYSENTSDTFCGKLFEGERSIGTNLAVFKLGPYVVKSRQILSRTTPAVS